MSAVFIRDDGLTLSETLAKKLDVRPGETVSVEVREGRRPVLELPVVQIARSSLGAPAYLEMSALNRVLKEPGRASGAYLRIDMTQSDKILNDLKLMPAIAGVARKEEARLAFRRLMDEGAGATRYVMAAIAAIITFGIVYNSARIAFAERVHDLATMRVIGFTKAEASFVLLGELGVIMLAALPFGILAGLGLAGAVAEGFSTDIYTVPSDVSPQAIGGACLAVLLSTIVSGWLTKRDIDRDRYCVGPKVTRVNQCQKRRSRNRHGTSLCLVFALGMILLLAWAFWPRPSLVDLGAVSRELMIVTIDEEARTRVRDAYVVSAPTIGRLLRVEVEPGDEVIGGETTIASMMSTAPSAIDIRTREQAQAGVRAAEAALRVARALT